MKREAAIIAALLALSATVGVFQALLRADGQDLRITAFGSMLPYAILLFMWCKADCARRGISPPSGAVLLVSWVAIIGIPYYYFRILPLLRAVIHILCAYLVLGLCAEAIALADWATWRVLSA